MNYREKMEFLSSYIRSMEKIQAYQYEYEKWNAIGGKITQTLSGMPNGNGNTSKVEKSAMELAEITDSIDDEIRKAKDNRNKVLIAIGGHKVKRYRDILSYRYINGLSVNKIADVIDKEPKTVYRTINKAIKSLEI